MGHQEEFSNLFRLLGDLPHDPNKIYDGSSLDGVNQKITDHIERFLHEKKNTRGILEFITEQLSRLNLEMVGLRSKGQGFEEYVLKSESRYDRLEKRAEDRHDNYAKEIRGLSIDIATSKQLHESNGYLIKWIMVLCGTILASTVMIPVANAIKSIV